MGSVGTTVDPRTQHPDVGKQVTIRSRNSWMNGQWGVVKMVDGNTYYVAPYNSSTEALVFTRRELRFNKNGG